MGEAQSKEEAEREEWLTEEDWAEFTPSYPLSGLTEQQHEWRDERMKERVEERKAERRAELRKAKGEPQRVKARTSGRTKKRVGHRE
tara:strand:- start:16 stop:276 length:261 start_codon:yes stop_codon:yes gene_type:complete